MTVVGDNRLITTLGQTESKATGLSDTELRLVLELIAAKNANRKTSDPRYDGLLLKLRVLLGDVSTDEILAMKSEPPS